MLPHVIVHNMVSVDGRMDWIKPDLGLYYEVAGRWQVDAILSGSETILAGLGDLEAPNQDEASDLSQEDSETPRSGLLMVIVDSRGRIRRWGMLRNQPYWRDAVALISLATPEEYLSYLQSEGVEFILAGEDRVDLHAALEALYSRYGVRTVRVDSGGTLNGVLLREGLVDEVSLLIEPSLVGGTSPRSFFVAPDLSSSESLIDLRLTHVEQLRDGIIWMRYDIVRS
jgi:2,5-diamino-6-(ribosylamino)-4(3H)-pyrimidinone 5'-phosphate reductase